MKIQAAIVFEAHTPYRIETVDLAPPQDGEVLVKIAAAGVCHSDWHLTTGATKHAMPVVPGHEGAGTVEAVGEGVSHVKAGDHVALNWAPNCGTCFYCLHDKPSLCSAYIKPIWAGTMMDGTTRLSLDGKPVYHYSGTACFAEYSVVPEACCVLLDPKIPAGIAALIGCAVTTGVGAALNTVNVEPGSSVAVFGAGGVGLNIIMGAKLAGASTIIAVDTNTVKGDIARDFGATDFVMAGPEANDQIRHLTSGRGADYAFEAIGITAVQEQCIDAIRPGGTVVFVGLSPMGSNTNIPAAVLARQEKTVTGSYYGSANTARDFPFFGDLYLKGKLDLDRLITKTYTLEQINEAYADMLGGEIARGVIVFQND